jgi:hypothetical protein
VHCCCGGDCPAVRGQLGLDVAGELIGVHFDETEFDVIERQRGDSARIFLGCVDGGDHVGVHESDVQRGDVDTEPSEFLTDVWVANVNDETQTVLSGTAAALGKAEAAGATAFESRNVSVASHR